MENTLGQANVNDELLEVVVTEQKKDFDRDADFLNGEIRADGFKVGEFSGFYLDMDYLNEILKGKCSALYTIGFEYVSEKTGLHHNWTRHGYGTKTLEILNNFAKNNGAEKFVILSIDYKSANRFRRISKKLNIKNWEIKEIPHYSHCMMWDL